MKLRTARAFLLTVAMAALAGCGGGLDDIAPKAHKQLPQKIVNSMKAKGMERNAPIMMRLFKEESTLEVWKQKTNGRYDVIATYDICKWSGELGPKYLEGDRQAPEGFYSITPANMNPNSQHHLSFNIGFPNTYDRANGRTGQHLMVHGGCSSSGCYSMTDEQVEQIYAFARDAFAGNQSSFQLQAYPFRMTPENMARYAGDPNHDFWTMLKEGYDHFEITKQPPKVDVCESRYVFNRLPAAGQSFNPTGACPQMSMPEALAYKYQQLQTESSARFEKLMTAAPSNKNLRATIMGKAEAELVADWSRRRARGEKVSAQPPSLPSPTEVAAKSSTQPATPAVAAPSPATPEQTIAVTAAPPAASSSDNSAITTGSVTAPIAADVPANSQPAAKGGRLANLFSRITGN